MFLHHLQDGIDKTIFVSEWRRILAKLLSITGEKTDTVSLLTRRKNFEPLSAESPNDS